MNVFAENLKHVRERIEQAAIQSGRSGEEITLISVSKTWPAEVVQKAVSAGATVLGENRIQEAESKIPLVSGPVSWHLIGHLQRNKVRSAIQLFDLIHSVDTLRLANEIGKRSIQNDVKTRVLVQVNTSGEASKFGVDPEGALDFVGMVSEVEGITVEGLMTIGAFLPDSEAVRPSFARLRELGIRIDEAKLSGVSMTQLSMGMTNDFEVAIQEGSTMVRIGTAIFGSRDG